MHGWGVNDVGQVLSFLILSSRRAPPTAARDPPIARSDKLRQLLVYVSRTYVSRRLGLCLGAGAGVCRWVGGSGLVWVGVCVCVGVSVDGFWWVLVGVDFGVGGCGCGLIGNRKTIGS